MIRRRCVFSKYVWNISKGKSPLILHKSVNDKFRKFNIIGGTEQVQTTGKNLIDYRNTVVGLLNFTDGSFSGTYHKYLTTDYIEIESGDYIISHNSMVGIQSYALYDINNKTYVSGKAGNNKVNIVEKCFIRISFSTKPETDVSANPIDYAKKCGIQLEKGASATPYEPHTGNKPSPSTEYPQEIKNSGKRNEEKQKYEVDVKVTGKNLLNLQKEPDAKGLYQGWKCGNGESLTLSLKDKGNNADIKGCYIGFSEQGSEPKGIIWVVDNGVIKTNPLTQKKAYVSIFPADETTIKKLTERFDIQCEYGSNATEHEPPREPQILTITSDRPITKWDRLVEQGGQIGWLYKSRIAGIPKTGYALRNASENRYGVYFSKLNIFKDAVITKGSPEKDSNIFTHFRPGNPYSSNGDIAWLYVAGGNTDLRIKVDDETINTVELFEQYISDKDIKILYETESTEFFPLPESEQNAIRALKTYYPTTVITVDSGEVQAGIEVEYAMK